MNKKLLIPFLLLFQLLAVSTGLLFLPDVSFSKIVPSDDPGRLVKDVESGLYICLCDLPLPNCIPCGRIK